MNKKTKMYLGLGVVAVAAYYFYHKAQMAKATAPATTSKFVGGDGKIFANAGGCAPGYTPVTTGSGTICTSDGYNYKPYPGFRPPAR